MPDMELVKNASGKLQGTTQEDQKRYEAFVKKVGQGKPDEGMAPGEFLRMKVTYPRNLPFHRKFMAMMRLGFDAWEPEKARKRLTYKGQPIEKSFDQFRRDIVIRAGYYTARFDARGRAMLEAKSIAFDQMSDDEFAEVYEACLKVLLEHILTNYTRDDVDRVVEEMQRFG